MNKKIIKIKDKNFKRYIISEIRGIKSTKNMSLKTKTFRLDMSCHIDVKKAIEKATKDFKATLCIEKLTLTEGNYKIHNVILQDKKDKEK